MSPFISGLDLNEQFFRDIVRPILAQEYPGLVYSAARLGSGSEILGYDDAMSTDHDWGPRFQLFLSADVTDTVRTAVHETLRQQLPPQFMGYSTNFGPPNEEGTCLLLATDDGPVDHRIEITTAAAFFEAYMAFDITQEPDVYDWLIWPQQHLLGVTRGRVFHDGLAVLEPLRRKLAYYPDDIWHYLLMAQWSRIGQEEHFVGRTGYRGDEVGSRVMAARLVHDLMQLGFLMEKVYAPYPKWFGTAFAELDCAAIVTPLFLNVLSAQNWQERERSLGATYEFMGRKHNQLGLTPPVEPTVRDFHERPFRIIAAERFAGPLRDAIQDPAVKAISTPVGSIDQFSHSTDLRSYPALHRRLKVLYRS